MKKNFLYSSVLLLLVTGIFLGFTSENPFKTVQTRGNLSTPVSVTTPGITDVATIDESFEGATFPPAGWTSLSPSGTIMWSRQLSGTSPLPGWTGSGRLTVPTGGGTAAAYVTYDNDASSNNEWLITPQITNVQTGDSLKFWLRYIVPAYADSFRVRISTTTPTIAAMTVPVYSKRYVGAADTGWVQLKFAIGGLVPNGSNIYIGFQESVADNLTDGSAFQLDLVSYTNGPAGPPVPTTWFEQTTPVTGALASISAANDNAVWAVGYTSSASGPPLVVRTTNGGTWTNALGTGIGAGVPLFNVWAIDANTALATGSTTSSFIYRTTDGGTTWSTVLTQAGGFFNAIVMSDANNGFVTGDPVGGRWSLFRTTNGGTTWDSTGMYLPQAGSEAGWNNCAQKLGNNIWFGTNNSKVYYSSNNGANWTAQATGEAAANGSIVWFNDANNGLYGGATLRATTNGGTVWNANTGFGTGNFSGITGTGSSWWTIRASNIVGFSSNNGTSWAQAYQTTGAGTLVHITKSRTGNLLYASKSNGGIVKYGVTTSITPVNTVAADYSLSQNYPNPFNPSTSIKFALPTAGFTTLKIYNMLGKEVATLVSSNLSAGTYSYDFNASALSSGVYFYKLESANFSEVKKMSLVK